MDGAQNLFVVSDTHCTKFAIFCTMKHINLISFLVHRKS